LVGYVIASAVIGIVIVILATVSLRICDLLTLVKIHAFYAARLNLPVCNAMRVLNRGRNIVAIPSVCASFTPDAIARLPSMPVRVETLVGDEHIPVWRLVYIAKSRWVQIVSVD
jgi:hypothetical protein